MASRIDKIEQNIATLHLEFSPEEFQSSLEKAYKKSAKRFKVPGFRPGKAPMGVAIRYYGEGVLYDDAIDALLQEAYPVAVREHELEPVDRPALDIEEIGRDKGLKLVLKVTVKPEVQLGQYKGVEAVRPDDEVKEEVVTAELERLRERNARMVPVEGRAVEEGDTANIDYEGLLDGVAFEGGTAQGYDLRIGSKTFIPGFEDQVIGHEVGEAFDVNVTFPEEYHSEELKGKAVVFKVKLNGIQRKELPELDDEFAKDVSEFDTLAEYRQDLRKQQEERAKERADREFEGNAVEAAVANMTVDLPEVMVENEVNDMVAQQEQQMRAQGFSLEMYLSYLGQTVDQFKEGFRENARKRVLATLLLEAIAKKEAFEVSEEDLKEEYKQLAERYGQKPEELEENVSEDFKRYLSDNIKIRKAVELIRENAIPVAPSPVLEVAEPAKKTRKKKSEA